MESKLWQIGMDTIYLLGCALHGQQPQRPVASNLAELYTFCAFHNITATVAVPLDMLWKENPKEPEQALKFRQAMASSVRKNILLNAEREQILRHLEEIGCWYMPLKGSLLQFDYPQFGMRQMSDNDILFDPSRREEVHEFLCRRGYEAVFYQTTVEDSYHKEPVYNFEMHTALVGVKSSQALREYYSSVKDRLILDEGKRYGYHFTPEDFYIYLIVHGWKHVLYSGIGIRFLADIWVYLRKHGQQLNWGYIDGELTKLGIGQFEQSCRQLSKKLLDAPDSEAALSEQERELLEQFLTAGAYGTSERKMSNQLKNGTGGRKKFRYVVSRIFPSAETLSLVYPHILEQKWKVPLIWFWRLIRAIFICPLDTVKELKMLAQKNVSP